MIDANFKMPPPPPRDVFPADVYGVQILDVDLVANDFYDPATPGSHEQQFKFLLGIVEPGKYLGKTMTIWASPKLSGGTKQSKLYQIVSAALGSAPTKEQMAKQQDMDIPALLNSMIGAQMRVTLEVRKNKTGDSDKNGVTAYLPAKEKYPEFVKA